MAERQTVTSGEYKKFVLPSGDCILYNSTESFPPGSGSVLAARMASYELTMLRKMSGNPKQPVNVLELGVGPGTFLAELLIAIPEKDGVYLRGIDIDPLSVSLTDANLKRVAK